MGPRTIANLGLFGWTILATTSIILISLFTVGPRATIVSEQGGFEIAGIAILGILTIAMWVWYLADLSRRWIWPLATTFFVLREFDFHNWYFEPGLLQAGLLTGPAPVWQKAIGLSVAIVILFTFGLVFWRGSRPLLRGLQGRASWAVVLAGGVALAAISTLFDGLDRKLAPYGTELSPFWHTAYVGVEEGLELLFVLSLVYAFARLTRSSATIF
jgi:hypothetical protein